MGPCRESGHADEFGAELRSFGSPDMALYTTHVMQKRIIGQSSREGFYLFFFFFARIKVCVCIRLNPAKVPSWN